MIEGVGAIDVLGCERTRWDIAPVLHDRASQFEAVFLQSMLESACIAEHFTGNAQEAFQQLPDSPDGHQFTSGIGHLPEQPVISSLPVIDPLSTFTQVENQAEVRSHPVDDFVKSIWPYVKQAGALIGLDPKILLAQVALETGWGHSTIKGSDGLSSYNIFNIKANAKDNSVSIKTTEYIENAPVTTMALFKKYDSIQASVDDYLSLMAHDRYQKALTQAHSPERYMEALQEAGYATDPHYAEKILSIYHSEKLQEAMERTGFS